MLPPLFINVRVREPGSHNVWVPLPFFLLWPLLLVFGVIALVIAAVADLVLTIAGVRFRGFTRFLIGVFGLLGAVRNTRVRVRKGASAVDVTIW